MRIIYRIARTELLGLLGLPISWVILAVFSLQSAYGFIENFGDVTRNVALDSNVWFVTKQLFSGSLFPTIQQSVYLYLPLLTMSLMGREYTSGSIKLLLSSPIKSSTIVFGKYLSMLLFSLLMLLSTLALIVFSWFTVGNLDFGIVLSGILGLFLLMSTYMAIGLLISSLIKYPIAAGLCTYAVFTALEFVGSLGADVPYVREITYWLSLSGKADGFISGILSSADFVYFIAIISLMLFLASLKLNSERGRYNKKKSTVYSVLALGVVCMVAYSMSKPSMKLYYDATETKMNTLTEESQRVMDKLGENPKITTFVNVLDNRSMRYASPKMMLRDMKRYEQYQRFRPDMELDYVYYYGNVGGGQLSQDSITKLAQRLANATKIDFDKLKSVEEVNQMVDLSNSNGNMTSLLECEGKSTFLNIYDDIHVLPGEREITSAFKILAGEAKNVCIMTGDSRPLNSLKNNSISHFFTSANNRTSLINQGCILSEWTRETDLDGNVDLLILADISQDISEKMVAYVKSYLEQGGDMMLMADKGSYENMNAIAALLGVQFSNQIIKSQDKKEPYLLKALPTDLCNQLMRGQAQGVVTMPTTSPLLFAKSDVNPQILLRNQEGEPLATLFLFDNNNREQRIFVSSDVDFLSFAELQTKRNNVNSLNAGFAGGVLNWMFNSEVPMQMHRDMPSDTSVTYRYEDLWLLPIAFVLVIPAVLLFLGLFIWIKRKRR